MSNFVARQWRGSEWRIYYIPTGDWVVFGTKARMKERAKELNQEEANERKTIQTPSSWQTLA